MEAYDYVYYLDAGLGRDWALEHVGKGALNAVSYKACTTALKQKYKEVYEVYPFVELWIKKVGSKDDGLTFITEQEGWTDEGSDLEMEVEEISQLLHDAKTERMK